MAEYARARGCSRAAVTLAAKRGQVHLVDGLVDARDADRTWPRAAGPGRPRASSQSGAPGGRAPHSLAQPAGANGNGSRPDIEDLDFWKERANHERVKAALAELELARQEGRLLESAEIEKEIFEAYRSVRESLLTIGDRIAPKLAGLEDPVKIHQLLNAALREVLEEIDARFRS